MDGSSDPSRVNPPRMTCDERMDLSLRGIRSRQQIQILQQRLRASQAADQPARGKGREALQIQPLDLSLPGRKRASSEESGAPPGVKLRCTRASEVQREVSAVDIEENDKTLTTDKVLDKPHLRQNDAVPGFPAGGAQGSKPYQIVEARDSRQWKRCVEEKTYEVKFDASVAGTRLVDIRDNLTRMFDDVIEAASSSYNVTDKAQLTINHSGMKDELFIHLQDLSNINGALIMQRFEKVLNSNEEMEIDDSFQIHVGLLRLTRGGGSDGGCSKDPRKRSGKALHLRPDLNDTIFSSISNKKSIVEIVCERGEFICAAKSIVICMAKLEKWRRSAFLTLTRKSRQCTNGPSSLRRRALKLQREAGLPTDAPLTVDRLSAFEEVLKVKICVIQFLDDSVDPCITQCSDRESDRVIFLYYVKGHFHAVVNPHAMFPKKQICMECLGIYNAAARNHPCSPSHCMVCNRKDCKIGIGVVCTHCNFTCRSADCYKAHLEQKIDSNGESKGKPQCEMKRKCAMCNKVVFTRKQAFEDHVCGQYECRNCHEFVEQDHLCYHRRRNVKMTSGKFIFFDFETMQDGVNECEDGYQPPPNDVNCNVCTSEHKCSKCRLCTKCRKSSCGRNVHHPNLVVSQSVCEKCKDMPLLPGAVCMNCGDLCKDCYKNRESSERDGSCGNSGCGSREKIFAGYDTVYEFCSWLISPVHRDYTVMAHYGKGYDYVFVLSYCVSEAKIKPEVIYAGSKIMSLHIKDGLNIRFIDSLNFMAMPLKKLPKAFGLKPEQELDVDSGEVNLVELQKGDFPHLMNTREHQDYVGPFPPLSMYSVNSMGKEEREKFKLWHASQQHKTFDLKVEMLAYCRLDVVILRLACMRFRALFQEVTTIVDDDGTVTGCVDPFAHVTIASACMQIYRVNYIEEYYDVELDDGNCGRAAYKSGNWSMDGEPVAPERFVSTKFLSSGIAQIPAQGYVRNSNHSAKSIAWLEWMSKKLGREIRHARNRGEKVIICGNKRYLADGFDEVTNTVLEFHGCRYHGCPKCMTGRKIKDPRTGYTMEDLYNMTKQRTEIIRAVGYKVVEIYECQFDAQVKRDADLAHFINNELDVPPRMSLRSSFYGGRTSCFSLYYDCDEALNEEIHYADVCSLYPYINKTAKMPVGHPEIITRDFDYTMKSYFGIAHLKVLPPKREYVPCLPMRMHGKLTFPLCKACAESECQESCTHADAERAITGVWCTPEIMQALSQGYEIVKIYEVYHYPETSQYDPSTMSGGLFSEQVNLFIKIKTEASGYPECVVSDADKEAYIARVGDKVGVHLDKDRICVNPALRSIAKICLNSFWGKLGERNNKVKTKFISSEAEMEKLQHNSSNDIRHLHIVNEDVMVVEYNRLNEFEEESGTTNEIIASFTTCFARLELLKHISLVGRNILYCDTDSIIFVTRKVDGGSGDKCYDVYPNLGDCLGELTNELPPDVFITRFVTTAPKSYSYQCNDGKEVCKFKGLTLNFQNSMRVNFQAVKELLFGHKSSITLAPQVQFSRSKFDGVVYNTDLVKTVKPTFTKRRILDNYDTVPFGYVDN